MLKKLLLLVIVVFTAVIVFMAVVIYQKYVFETSQDMMRQKADLCIDNPTVTDIGRSVYPIDPTYEGLGFLGQLFTAADCGQERLNQIQGVEGDNYTLGSTIWLWLDPTQSLIDTLKDVGFQCVDESSDASCKHWRLSKTVKVYDLLKLKQYYGSLKQDDCVNCG